MLKIIIHKKSTLYRYLRLLYNIVLSPVFIFRQVIRGETTGLKPLFGSTVHFPEIRSAVYYFFNRSNLVEGDSISQYELLFEKICDVKYAFSFLGGRVALSAIIEALDLSEGDEVILPAFTCVVVPNALFYRGIKLIYADIDKFNFNILPSEIGRCFTPRTKAIIIQHLFGLVADLEPLLEEARKYNLLIIEDCAHSLGAEYKKKKIGSFGIASFFSTEQSKIISTQAGGVAVTNDKQLAIKLESIQQNTPFPEPEECKERLIQFIVNYLASRQRWNLLYLDFFKRVFLQFFYFREVNNTTLEDMRSKKTKNYMKKLPNCLASLGVAQLKKLHEYEKRRIAAALTYKSYFENKNIRTIPIQKNSQPVFLRYPIYVRDKELFVSLAKNIGIEPGVWFSDVIHPKGVNLENVGYTEGQCPNAEFAAKHLVNLSTAFPLNQRELELLTVEIENYYT